MRVYTDAGLWEVMSNWDEVQHIDTKPYFQTPIFEAKDEKTCTDFTMH